MLTGVDLEVDLAKFMNKRKSGGSRKSKMQAAIKKYRESNQADNSAISSSSSSRKSRKNNPNKPEI